MDKTLILNKIKEYYKLKTNADFARFLDVSPQLLSNWYARKTFDHDILYTKCEGISGDWLLTGSGEMFVKGERTSIVCEPQAMYKTTKKGVGIPLIPVRAMAGMFTMDSQVLELECERYIVPNFSDADFLIQVKGDSMTPKYFSGDIIACKKLTIDAFFQWNKVYVLDTDQGALIKRIHPGKSDNTLLILSENEKYPAFELHRAHIHNIALVVGLIRVE